MTREEEIKKRLFEISTSNFNNSVVDSSAYFAGYIDGAKWADYSMLNKACEWLERNYHATPSGGYYYLPEDCIKQFKQAMEGE